MDRLNITNEQWDYLIVLDACRYDYFEQVYRKYLKGRLTRKISIGPCTNEWRDKSFPDYYDDIIYISANPQISATSKVYGYCAGDHFHKVHEVWNDQWDKKMGTVLPETLTTTALKIIGETAGQGKRYIIHYLQPHGPYLSLGSESRGYIRGDVNKARRLVGFDGNEGASFGHKAKLIKKMMRFLRRNSVFLSPPEWYLRKFLLMPPMVPMEAAWRNVGREALRNAYRDNVIAVVKQVAVLVAGLSGRIVVTADHGELLGERLCYGHPCGSRNPILINVPWLVIEKKVGSEKPIAHAAQPAAENNAPGRQPSQSSEKEIAEKLRALGYLE